MNRWADTPVTAVLALGTLLASALILLTGALDWASVQGGFVPARVGHDVAGFVLPWILTPLTTTLVHGGWAHLLFNLVMLGYVGREAERVLGTVGTGVLYGIGAYLAAAAQWLAGPDVGAPMIGASGAISALVGAYALLFGQRRATAIGPVPAGVAHVLWLAAGWIGVQLLIGASEPAGQPIAIWAHIGGFAAGLALARPLLLWRWRGA